MIQNSKAYRVTISNGQVDNFKPTDELKEGQEINIKELAHDDEDFYLPKAQAFVRYHNVCRALQKGLDFLGDFADANLREETKNDKVPSTMKFTVLYTQPDGMFVYVDEGTENAITVKCGAEIKYALTGADAIKKVVEDELKADHNKVIAEVFNAKTTNNNGYPMGYQLKTIDVPGVSASVVVEEIIK